MSAYHCPLCPLIFQYRSEAEWHLREEHRSRVDEEAGLRTELSAAAAPLDWERLRILRASPSRPSVTLLMSTLPGPTMTILDIARLRQLAERARRRLVDEPDRRTAASVVEHRLAKAVSAAESLPAERGLSVLVNQHDLAIVTLPFAPRDRQVVDDGFATRDLEYTLGRYPRYRALVLGRRPRILEGRGDHLTEPSATTSHEAPRVVPGPRTSGHHEVDALLARQIELAGPLPLIVIGDRRRLDRFRRSPYYEQVVAERLRSRLRQSTPSELAVDAHDRWLHQRQQHTVAELRQADQHNQLAWGLEAAWSALHSGKVDRLWVEHDYAVPGRILPGDLEVHTTTDPAEPGVIDDLVDALIAKSAKLGIPVNLLDRGALNRPEPLAARIPLATSTTTAVCRSLLLAAA
jgi:hypothetical protein